MSTAKPQRTKGKPAQAKATHEHKWGLSPMGMGPEFQSCQECNEVRRTPGYVAPTLCPPEHAAFADLLATCEALFDGIDNETVTMTYELEQKIRAAIAKAKPS